MDKLPIEFLDEPTDEPPVSFDDILHYISAFLAGFGLAAFIMVCWLAGLYYGVKK